MSLCVPGNWEMEAQFALENFGVVQNMTVPQCPICRAR